MMARRLTLVAVIALLASVAACGGGPPASAPQPKELLSRSQAMHDFRITYTAHLWAEGQLARTGGSITVQVTGAGSVVVSSTLMATLHETSTFCSDLCSDDLIVVGDDRYTRSRSSLWWLDRGVPVDSYLWSMILPFRLAEAIAPRVVGQATLDGAETWVVDATTRGGHSFRAWIRQQDGYPVQLESAPSEKTSFLDLRISLDRFNSGVAVAAPPKDQLHPLFWGTRYVGEHPIPLAAGWVTIHNAGFDCSGGSTYDDSRPDAYPVLVPFTYTAGTTPLSIDPASWTLYDASGHPYRAQPLGSAPRLFAQSLPAGRSTSGDLCFLVPWGEDNLTIVGDFPSGVVTSFVGGLRRPDSVG